LSKEKKISSFEYVNKSFISAGLKKHCEFNKEREK